MFKSANSTCKCNRILIVPQKSCRRFNIETDEDRSYFLMFIPVHEGCGNVITLKEQKEDLPKDYPKITQIPWAHNLKGGYRKAVIISDAHGLMLQTTEFAVAYLFTSLLRFTTY